MMPKLTGYETHWRKSLAIWMIEHSRLTKINRDEMFRKYLTGPRDVREATKAVDKVIKPFGSNFNGLSHLYDICEALDAYVTQGGRLQVLKIAKILGENGILSIKDLREYSGTFDSLPGIGQKRANLLRKAQNLLRTQYLDD